MTSTRSMPLAPAIARTCSVCGVRPDCESRCGSAARRTYPIAILRSLAVAGNFALGIKVISLVLRSIVNLLALLILRPDRGTCSYSPSGACLSGVRPHLRDQLAPFSPGTVPVFRSAAIERRRFPGVHGPQIVRHVFVVGERRSRPDLFRFQTITDGSPRQLL